MMETRSNWPPPSWSAIPTDIAGLVLRLLPAYADRARFAAVCPQWRAAARQLPLPPPPVPLLALPDGTFYSLPYGNRFRFPGCGFAEYQTACGRWLVFQRDEGCFLVDPFTKAAAVALPALSGVQLCPPHAVARSAYERRANLPEPDFSWRDLDDLHNLHISKVILCSPNLVAALVRHGFGQWSQILVCQPGASSWSVRLRDACKVYEDLVFFNGKLYALVHNENLLVVSITQDQTTGDPQVSRIGRVIDGEPWYPLVLTSDNMSHKKLYLVESCGELLMVRRKVFCWAPEPRTPHKVVSIGNEFQVFKADFEHSRWVEVTTAGDDQVLFLGRMCSRAVSASRYGLPGDRIFFLDDDEQSCKERRYDKQNTSYSAYDMKSGEVPPPHPMISWKRRDAMRLAAWLFPQD